MKIFNNRSSPIHLNEVLELKKQKLMQQEKPQEVFFIIRKSDTMRGRQISRVIQFSAWTEHFVSREHQIEAMGETAC